MHVLRGDSLLRTEVIDGKTEGNKWRGRPRQNDARLDDGIHGYGKLREEAQQREELRFRTCTQREPVYEAENQNNLWSDTIVYLAKEVCYSIGKDEALSY